MSRLKSGLLTRTDCPRRLSFSQFRVLMSTLKDNLLGQTVLVKRTHLNLEQEIFVVHPLFSWKISHLTEVIALK